jgi:hypothetical protein
LQFADAQKGGAHEGDDDAGDDAEDAFPDVFGGFEGVAACGIDWWGVSIGLVEAVRRYCAADAVLLEYSWLACIEM